MRSRSASSGDGDIVLPARPQPYRQRVIPKTDSVDQDGEWTLFDDNGVSRYRCELCRKVQTAVQSLASIPALSSYLVPLLQFKYKYSQ